MLKQINVWNYALIDSVELTFHPGLTAITGETGSGKSILLGALGLLIGDRFDQRMVRNPKAKCIVEAHFSIREEEFASFFREHDLDMESVTSIRREIGTSGKSRSFINDTPVSLSVLKALGEQLVDIHSQHENSILGDRSFQFSVIDAFAGNMQLRKEYQSAFHHYTELTRKLESSREQEMQMRKDVDYIHFQLRELTQVKLEEINQADLEQELEILQHAGQIRSTLTDITTAFESDNSGILSALSGLRQHIQRISAYHATLGEFASRIEALIIESGDLTSEINSFSDQTEFDDQRIAAINERLGEIYRLQQKYRVSSVEELVHIREDFAAKAEGFSGLDGRIIELEREVNTIKSELDRLAESLSERRVRGALSANKEVSAYLRELHLEHGELLFDLQSSSQLDSFGADEIRLLFSANKGSTLQPIRAVASGGEISRVMLALKAAISRHRQLPLLILDEIDQGISGEIALKTGDILHEMSGTMQVITITHLPQIAGKADHQFRVFKTTGEDSTTTGVMPLSQEQRVEELAQMLGGKKRSQTSVEQAKELLIRS